MNRLKEVKELKALAEELQLENREIIRKYKITKTARSSANTKSPNLPVSTTASDPTPFRSG